MFFADIGYLALQCGAWLTWACLAFASVIRSCSFTFASHPILFIYFCKSHPYTFKFFVKTFLVYFSYCTAGGLFFKLQRQGLKVGWLFEGVSKKGPQ